MSIPDRSHCSISVPLSRRSQSLPKVNTATTTNTAESTYFKLFDSEGLKESNFLTLRFMMWPMFFVCLVILSSVTLVQSEIVTKNGAIWDLHNGQNGSIQKNTGIHTKPVLSVRSVEDQCDYERIELTSSEQQLMDIYESGMALIQQNLEILRIDVAALKTVLRDGDVALSSYEDAFDQLERQFKVHELHYHRCNASVWTVLDGIAAYLHLEATELLHAEFEELRGKLKAYTSVIRSQILSHSLSQVV